MGETAEVPSSRAVARPGLALRASGHGGWMSVISTCIEPGCSTLCIGLFCIEHDARPQVDFPRGQPWPPLGIVQAAAAPMLSAVTPEPALAGAVRPAA